MSRKFTALMAVGGLALAVGLGAASQNARAGSHHGGYAYDDDDACGWAGCGCGGSACNCGGWSSSGSCGGYSGCGYSSCGCYSSCGGYSACGGSAGYGYGNSGYGSVGYGLPAYYPYMYGYGTPAYGSRGYGYPASRSWSPLTPGYGSGYPAYNDPEEAYGGGYGAAKTGGSTFVNYSAGKATVRDGIPEVQLLAH